MLAELCESSGAKFVTMVRRLGVGRASLSVTLQFLVSNGLVRRNTGYGHPLRPEYLLTPNGRKPARQCLFLVNLIRNLKADKIAYRKWSLPVVQAIGDRQTRFSALRRMLGISTPRALILALKALGEIGWIEREIGADYPPVATYRLSASGKQVAVILNRLGQNQSREASA